MDPTPVSPNNADGGLEPAAALATISEQQTAYLRHMEVHSAPLYLAWGLAWLIGYGVCGLSVGGDYELPRNSWLAFMGCLAAAAVFTCVYIARRSRGLRGRTSWIGMLYGLAWAGGMILAFTTTARLGAFLNELGTAQAANVGSIVANALPCLVVGVLFLAGAAIWEETTMAVTGGWILVVTTAATVVGGHALWAIMALAGGGGLLAAGILTALLGRRQSAAVRD
ncbi:MULTISPECIES: hypothetical protein [Actinomyces]|uniref:Uncharacterized protein n=1 Tax=Actinomyces glycerinitolerans TaxID=1892869 RepID=A0A1M4S2P5_9ACTO|nr:MULTISPECIES: hypothetical protein [Actinomyces]RAX19285.1 hypothetical protein DRB06_13685 [Actinomyces sp. Z5]RAX23965.1 hypothetical protein DRB07_02000 [Actinomyces sp. Z3]SHE26429.1 Hypothetical protein ACGLYG10_2680 [Actinomyces glycerinitolerans]